jgi:hypothetical protein
MERLSSIEAKLQMLAIMLAVQLALSIIILVIV